MKQVLITFLMVFLVACQSTDTPPPPTIDPATPSGDITGTPTVVPPPTSTVTTALTETPTTPPTPTGVASFPDPAAYTWTTVVSGLERPVNFQPAGDGSGRLFVIEKVGRIRIIQDGQLIPTQRRPARGRAPDGHAYDRNVRKTSTVFEGFGSLPRSSKG